MSNVTVQGRDELGRVIDVNLTTTGDAPPPGPETVSTSGVQTIRLLEATVNFGDANLQTTGTSLGWTFTEGQWIIDAWVQVFTNFLNGDSTYVNAYITTDSASPGAIPLTGWDISIGETEDVTTDFEHDPGTTGDATVKRLASNTDATHHRGVPARVRVDCNALFVAAPDQGGAFNSGQCKVFALIAEST